jgi:Transglutaminase-like superfamily
MRGFGSLCHDDSNGLYSLKETFLLYKRVIEQYRNPEILKIMRSLIPDNIVSQTKDGGNVIPLLKWFKNDFMRWTSKDPVCQKCINTHSYKRDDTSGVINSSSSISRSSTAPMQVQTIIGNSWRMRKLEMCNNSNYEYTFPRYGEILKIAETRAGRCSEWSMLFGAMLSSLGMKTEIIHDFLDHCWNEAIILPNEK